MPVSLRGCISPARCGSARAFVALLAATTAGGAFAGSVVVEPVAWDFGVRPRDHLITRTVRLRPGEGRSVVRIARVRASCECLNVEILRARGDPASPAEMRAVMDTNGFRGPFRKSIFIALAAPSRGEVVVPVTGWVLEKGPGEVEVFFAAGEPSGERLLEWWRGNAARAKGADRVRLLPIEKMENYTRLRELEEESRMRGPSPDVVAFAGGGIVLRGADEVEAGLTGFLDLDGDGRPSPSPGRVYEAARPALSKPEFASAAARAPDGVLEIWLFYFPDCRGCRRAVDALGRIAREREGKVRLVEFDTSRAPESVPLAFALAESYPQAPDVLPSAMAFVGDGLLLGVDDIVVRAETLVEEQLARGGEHLRVRRPGEVEPLAERPGALGLAPLVLAGLADGVNPCAFAAMVLLIAVLSAAGTTGRRELILGGGAFCAGVFVTYYLAGLALFAGVKELRGFPVAEAAVFWAVWAVAVLGGCLSLWDAAAYLRTRDPGRVRLKVPEAFRRRFAPLLRGRFRRWGLPVGGFAGGVLIAVLEGVCTGQMYLPAVQYMARTPGLRTQGAAWLLLYNALFVLPLILILGVAVAGVHFHRLSGFLRRHLAAAKLALAAVFFLLAAGMIIQR